MGSVGWAAVAMIARQRNNQRGEVVAVTVRMPSQPSPLLALPRQAAWHVVGPLLTAPQGRLCARVPLLVAFPRLHVPPGHRTAGPLPVRSPGELPPIPGCSAGPPGTRRTSLMERWARCGLSVLLVACWYAPGLRQRGDPGSHAR